MVEIHLHVWTAACDCAAAHRTIAGGIFFPSNSAIHN